MLIRSRAALAVISAILASALPFGVAGLTVQGCGGVENSSSGSGGGGGSTSDGGQDAGPTVVTLHPDAAPLPGEADCTVVETTGIPAPSAQHLPVCTPISYKTNPPSGGDHWPTWAAYAEYTSPVPREMYTHNLEHGGVVITYSCKDSCPEVKAALEEVFKNAVDTYCVANGPVQTRAVLTPDPNIPTPIAASAWRATYTATCIDKASLSAFVANRFGHGTEPLCADGFDPTTTVQPCKDGG